MTTASTKTELASYIKEMLSLFKRVETLVAQKNKTQRMKALKNISILYQMRLQGIDNILSSGGKGEDAYVAPIEVHRSLYDDVIMFLINEAGG